MNIEKEQQIRAQNRWKLLQYYFSSFRLPFLYYLVQNIYFKSFIKQNFSFLMK